MVYLAGIPSQQAEILQKLINQGTRGLLFAKKNEFLNICLKVTRKDPSIIMESVVEVEFGNRNARHFLIFTLPCTKDFIPLFYLNSS